jgi:O-acetyl-ADP-ribose deacetylase (regulator of RNase III)
MIKPDYLSAGGGVSLALLQAAGDPSVRAEMDQHVWGGPPNSRNESKLKAGDAVVTSAGKLRAKYLIHAVSLDFDHPMAEDIVE